MDVERTIARTGPEEGLDRTTLLGDETEPTADRDAAPRLARGATVDRYVIVDELGAGGMGVVYLAYDPELDRRVAIKLLLPSMLGEGRPRLVREAQAIARIAHPNVVAVYDVGEIDGSIFVAMEMVEGRTMGQWLRETSRAIPEILEVFAQAGRGLAAAHAADLVHRDFKPENVLIGDDGRVRVVDFGLARGRGSDESIGPRASMSSSSLDEALTEHGAVMGTPAYMSPEQLAGHGATAASDQFAFCVALYEALYGERPFAGKNIEEISRAVFRSQIRDPPAGRSVPSWLRRVLLRGLSTSPVGRYPDMESLVGELLRDPGSPRRRMVMASVLTVGAVGVAALAYQSGAARDPSPCTAAADELRAVWHDERSSALAAAFLGTNLPHAEDTWSRVSARIDEYAAGWSAQATEACEATLVTHQQPAELLQLRRRCLDERLQRLDAFLDVIATPDATVIDRAVQGVRGLPDLAGCRDTKTLEAGLRPPEQEQTRHEVEAIEAALTRAEALSAAARYPEQVELLQGLLTRARATSYMPIVARVEHALAGAERALDRPEGVATQRLAFRDALAAGDDRLATMSAVDIAYELGYEQRLHEQGLEWSGIAQALLHRIGGDPKIEISLTNTLAVIAVRQARYDEATALFEQVVDKQRTLDPDDPNLAVGLMNLGSAYAERRDFDHAREYLQQSAELTERLLGPRHPRMTALWANLAVMSLLRGRYEEAEQELVRTIELQRAVLGARHLEYARSLAYMAIVKRNLGDPVESERLHREVLEIRREKLGADHPEVAESLRNLAHALRDQGRLDEAIELTREAGVTSARRQAPDHPDLGNNATLLAELLADTGRHRDALVEAERAIEILDAKGPGPTASLDARRVKGRAERGLGRYAASVATLEAALTTAQAHDADVSVTAKLRFELAASLLAVDRSSTRAHPLAQQALETLRATAAGHRGDVERIEAWQAEHPEP